MNNYDKSYGRINDPKDEDEKDYAEITPIGLIFIIATSSLLMWAIS